MPTTTLVMNGRVLLGRAPSGATAPARPSFWTRLGARLYAAMEQSGRRRAARALLAHPLTLERAGISRAELEAMLR
jgi:hypothetical protein